VVLLVLVDENVATHRREEAGAIDLRGLVDTVPVREDGDVAERPEPRDHIQGARIEVTLERHAQDRAIDVFGARLVRKGAAEAPERLGIVNDAFVLSDLLVQRPEAPRAFRGDRARDRALDVLLDAVVIDQRVVDVEKKYERPYSQNIPDLAK
jgi:hypothetical protein